MRSAAIIIDDDTASRTLIEDAVRPLDCDIVTASSPGELLAAASGYQSCIVFWPLDGTDVDSSRLRRKLGQAVDCFYLIFIIDRYARKLVTRAFESGADDVVARPLNPVELTSRVRHAASVLALEEMRRSLEKEASLFDEIAARADFHSRRYLNAQLASELTRALRFGHCVSLVLAHVDTDPWDERTLRALGSFLARHFRSKVDWIARYDEHRLAFVLPETSLDGAIRATQRLDTALSNPPSLHPGLPPDFSIRFGVISLDSTRFSIDSPPDTQALLDTAEGYLHEAMRSGREIVSGPVPHP